MEPELTTEERRGFDNLMLMCPTHHSRIDFAERRRYPAEVLRRMKATAEDEAERREPVDGWDDRILTVLAQSVVVMEAVRRDGLLGSDVTVGDLLSAYDRSVSVGDGVEVGADGVGVAPDGVEVTSAASEPSVLTAEDGQPLLTEDGRALTTEGAVVEPLMNGQPLNRPARRL